MPSLFMLEGPRLGAIAVPGGRAVLFGRSRSAEYGLLPPPARLFGSPTLGDVVSAGLGEMSTFAKAGLISLGLAGAFVIFVTRLGKKSKSLRGARRRRRRRH